MRKALRILLYGIAIILAIVFIAVIWLNTKPGKEFVRDKLVSFLRNKLKTEVQIGELGYGLPKYVSLQKVLFKDQANDTLLYAGNLRVNINMLKLISGKVDVQKLTLEGVHAHVYRHAPDTNFNFTYIINAFAGDPKKTKEEKPKDTTSSGMSIDVNKILLNDIHARFDDQTGGTRLAVNLQYLELGMKKIDLKAMDFHVKNLDVTGLATTFYQDTSYLPPSPPSNTKSKLLLAADNIDLKNIFFTYGDNKNKMVFDLKLGSLKTKVRTFDLENEKIAVERFDLGNTTAKMVLGKHSQVPEKVAVIVDTLPQSKWRVTANTLNLDNIRFAMDDENKPQQVYGMDYAHLDLQKLALHAKDVLYTADSIIGNVNHLAVQEKSGFDLQELRTVFAYHAKGGYLKNLYLQTPHTVLQNYLEVAYPSLDSLKTAMGRMAIRTNLVKSTVGLSDVLIFAPELRKQELFRRYGNSTLQFEAVLNGYLGALNINNFYVAGLHHTVLSLKGKMRGLPDSKKLNYDLNILKLQSTAADLNAILPPSVLKQLNVPASVSIAGNVNGTIQDYNTNLVMLTSDGAATVKGYIHMSPGKGREKYDLYVNTRNLDVGKIIRKDSLIGAITAVMTAKGQSFDINNMNAAVKANILSAGLKGYNYSHINLDGNVAHKAGVLSLLSADPNLVMQMHADMDFTAKDPAVVAQLNIDSADFRALKLSKDELRLRTLIHADFPSLNVDYPDGVVNIDQTTITAKGQRYFLDSLFISSKPNADTGQHIVVQADFMNAEVTGKTPLSKIGDIIQEHISRHYNIGGDSVKKAKAVPADYDLAVNMKIQDRPLLHILLPGLESMDTIGVKAALDPRNLSLNVDAPMVVYAGNTIDSAKVRVNGTDSELTYSVSLNKLTTPAVQLWKTSIAGQLQGQEITANIKIADSADKDRFAVNAVLQQNGNEQVLQLKEGLLLNYKTWQVLQPNKIVFGKEGFYAQGFGFSNSAERISISSQAPQYNSPLHIDIDKFFISNITEILQKDTLLANGVLNTKLTVENLTTAPQASGSLQVQDLSVKNDTIGNLDVQLINASANAVAAKITISGNGNDIAANGNYFPKPVNGNNFDLKLDINNLNLKTVEGLAMNQIRNSSGNLKGTLLIKGTPAKPIVTGELKTQELATTVKMLGAPFKMPQERIVFREKGVTFDNFNIYDSLGNKATITGDVITEDLKNIRLAMQLNAKKWMVLNSTPADNKLFYGRLVMSSRLGIKGPLSAPVIDGKLTIHDTTKFTVVIPQSQPGIEDSKGIVEFVDMDDPHRYTVLPPKDTTEMPKMAIRSGASVDVNLAIEKNAEFSVIIDESTGDFLRVRGEANLNTVLNPDGTIGLAGTYELKQGAYELNYNLIKRKFNIQPGSTIVFAGDPTKADVDITAVYTANVPPYDLVEKQVSDPAQLNYYKQRLPFDVQLKLKGALLKPVISFDIVLPEEKKYRVSADVTTLVQGKLSQIRTNPSELNKQVFALLILNRFISDNPFESGAGGTSAEYIARQSASRFLSEQLNKFAGDLINGLEVNLDLQSTEDYTTGSKRNQTNLNVSASKRLLDDRLTVTVGNDFGLEGQNQNTNQNTSLIPGNLALDYQLSPDGRYMTRIYRKNELEDIIEGYVVETGVSFIVTVEYNKFKTLFKKRDKERRGDDRKDNDNKKSGVNN